MNILIIEDCASKYEKIKETLNKILENPNIVWMNSVSSGLASFRKRNRFVKENQYNLVITDNYLPLDDSDMNLEPHAKDIIDFIRRMGFDKLPIIVCSSERLDECGYDYMIEYDQSVSLDEPFKDAFEKLKITFYREKGPIKKLTNN